MQILSFYYNITHETSVYLASINNQHMFMHRLYKINRSILEIHSLSFHINLKVYFPFSPIFSFNIYSKLNITYLKAKILLVYKLFLLLLRFYKLSLY